MEQTFNEMKRSNELTLRSWLFPVGWKGPLSPTLVTPKTKFSVRIQNHGKIPAYDICFIGPNQQFVKKLPPKMIVDPDMLTCDKVTGNQVLPPGQWTEVSFDVGPITEERAQLILSKPPRLYFLLLGVARYSDIFAKDRPSTFCYLYSPELEIFINCPGRNTVP